SPPQLPSPPPTSHKVVTPPVSPPPGSLSPLPEDPPLPEIEIPAVPKLPDIVEKTIEQGKKREKLKFMVDTPPPLQQVKEEPKKRRATPKIRTIPRKMFRQRKTRPAEAPVTTEELKDIHDPLDFLARWCIINPDRLPFYELVFEYTVADQTPLYPRQTQLEPPETQYERKEQLEGADNGEIPGKKEKKKHKKGQANEDITNDRLLNTRLLPAERGMNFMKTTMTVEEQHLEKLIYTMDLLHDKMLNLGSSLEELEAKRVKLLAGKARETFPQIASPSYTPKNKKGKKGKKKDKQAAQLKSREITDAVIVDRLYGKMLNELCREPDVKFLECEIEILQDKIRGVQRRVEDIAREKLLTDAFCMNHYFLRQGLHGQSEDFKRQQSELYNRLHPAPDFEMNMEEVEHALQQINNHLLTKHEFNFLYNVLNLPGREKINFRLFTVIAALSEKVTQLDPVIRKMMNNFDYNALDIKMEKCKELFGLLDMDHMPQGAAQAESLAVELTAGGLKPENTRYVLNKFNRESKGAIDFLDFVTYIPLFVEIHKRIIQDPLKADLDL
ncbi:unnamed protein product, partial [Candidula unifasciata]